MKKGISLIVLFIVVLVIIILATTLTVTGINVYNNSKITRFATEMAYVKEALDAYRTQNNGMYPIKDAVVLDISQVSSKAKVQFQDENITDNKVTLYEIDFSLLGVNELSYGNKKEGDKTDVYVVSMDTSNVYYAKGYKVNNNTYYTLTDELKEAIGYNINENAINKDGLIFKPSTTEWTNKNVEVEVLVPKVYTSVTITAKKGNQATKTINSGVTKEDYVIYSVNGVQGNYDIEVKYQKEGSVKEQLYQVTNVDNVAPTLEIVSQSKMVNEDKNDKKTVIEIKVTDDLSQIAFTKYEDDNIPENIAKQYFSGNGKTVNDDMLIEVEENKSIVTVYVQDKAGNSAYKQVHIDVATTRNVEKESDVLTSSYKMLNLMDNSKLYNNIQTKNLEVCTCYIYSSKIRYGV